LSPLGRVFPNLVLSAPDPTDATKESEFWVKLEIPIGSQGDQGYDRILKLLREASKGEIASLDELEAMITDQMDELDKTGEPRRQAFREIVHCAFEDHRVRLSDPKKQTNCPDTFTVKRP